MKIIKSSLHADLFLIRGHLYSSGNQNHNHVLDGGLRRVAASPVAGAAGPAVVTSIGGAGGQCPWAECASCDRATAASSSTRSTQPLAGPAAGVDPGIHGPGPPPPPASPPPPPPAPTGGADAVPNSEQPEKESYFSRLLKSKSSPHNLDLPFRNTFSWDMKK